MYNIKHGLFRGRDSVPPCIDDVLEPEAPVAIDFNNSVLETLWCMDMMYAPRSQEVTIMEFKVLQQLLRFWSASKRFWTDSGAS